MKNSIRLSIIFLLFAISLNISGQTFGIKAGYNLPFMVIEKSEYAIPYDTYVKSTKLSSGYHFGGTIEFPVYKMFSFETGLIFSNTGYKQSYEETIWPEPLNVTEAYNIGFLNIPLTAKASFPVGSVNIYGFAGGYFGIGLAGSIKTKVIYGDTTESEKRSIKWGSEQGADDFKRFDYGITFGAGVVVKSFQVGIAYNMGLANLSPASKAGSNINNSVLGLSVGYMFGMPRKSGPVIQKGNQSNEKIKSEIIENPSGKPRGKKAAALEAERVRLEKVRADSIVAVRAEEERLRVEKVKADSIEAARVMAANRAAQEAARLAKIKADSLTTAQNTVFYRVQFASNTAKKGSYEITIGGKKYNTWEYSYSGAFRSTVGEFKTYKSALEFQKSVRQSGYPQAFVVALKNNVRVTDPALFK
jgi:hypothetical protein